MEEVSPRARMRQGRRARGTEARENARVARFVCVRRSGRDEVLTGLCSQAPPR